MSYRIGPGDILSFRSFDDEKLSMQVPVRYDGYVSLQVIPDVKVEGLTRKEAEDLVREAYAEYYLEPQLTLSISEVKSKIFTVLGDVSRPSEYPYTRPITLMNAITIAGGPRVNTQGGDSYVGSQGQLVKAFLVRNTGNERKVFEFDLRGFQKSGPSPSDTPVYPDDTVYVPESANLVFLLGEVRQPRVYAVSEGLTLIRLLSLAGGYNESTARIREVAITREINDMETKIITFDVREAMRKGTDFSLEPGDIIYVPRKRLVNAEDFLQRVIAPASTGMSFAGQIMGLYQQAYSAYYTREQFDRIYSNSRNSGDALTSSLQSLQQNLLQNTQSLQGILSGATQLVPSVSK
ncbi:MAG: polysaccharide biosynthesis/export family protein [Candidatus Hydrogenedentales bacterium]|jgi:polysaccharide export outer membrane protein